MLVEGWYRLADAYLRLEDTARAVTALRRAVAIDPDHVAATAALRLFDH